MKPIVIIFALIGLTWNIQGQIHTNGCASISLEFSYTPPLAQYSSANKLFYLDPSYWRFPSNHALAMELGYVIPLLDGTPANNRNAQFVPKESMQPHPHQYPFTHRTYERKPAWESSNIPTEELSRAQYFVPVITFVNH